MESKDLVLRIYVISLKSETGVNFPYQELLCITYKKKSYNTSSKVYEAVYQNY